MKSLTGFFVLKLGSDGFSKIFITAADEGSGTPEILHVAAPVSSDPSGDSIMVTEVGPVTVQVISLARALAGRHPRTKRIKTKLRLIEPPSPKSQSQHLSYIDAIAIVAFPANTSNQTEMSPGAFMTMIASQWESLAQRRVTKANIKTQEVLIFIRMLTIQHAPLHTRNTVANIAFIENKGLYSSNS